MLIHSLSLYTFVCGQIGPNIMTLPNVYYTERNVRIVKSKQSLTSWRVNTTGAALHENNEASAKLTTANGGTFTSCSARLSSQSRYSTLDRWLTWLATDSGWARGKRSAICSGKLISAYMIPHDVNSTYGIVSLWLIPRLEYILIDTYTACYSDVLSVSLIYHHSVQSLTVCSSITRLF